MGIEIDTGVKKPSFDVLPYSVKHQMRECNNSSEDTIESSGQDKESLGTCATNFFCFLPNLMWHCVKKILCVLTCGCICNEKPNPKEMKVEVEKVLKVWKKEDATKEQKTEALNCFFKKCPGAKEELIEANIEQQCSANKGLKATEAEKTKWREDNAKKIKNETEDSLVNHNSEMFENYLEKLKASESQESQS